MMFLIFLGLMFCWFIEHMADSFKFKQILDHWLTLKFLHKRYLKKAERLGFVDLYINEIENCTVHRPLSQITCFNAYRFAMGKHRHMKTISS
jgi:hypothetical protein